MTMKENQNETFVDSKSFTKEIDPATFGGKEVFELNDSKMDDSLLEAKDRDESWHHKVMDDISVDNENRAVDSPTKKEDIDEPLNHLSSWENDLDSLSSKTYDKDKERQSPEFTHRNGNELHDSSSPCNSALGLSETDANLFTDKNVLECGMPELEVFYKEIDYQIVKDICVDEGRSENDKDTESCKDDISDRLFPLPTNDNHSEDTEANQRNSKSSSDSSFDEDTDKDCDPAKSVEQTSETNCGASGNVTNDNSEDDSLLGVKPQIQEIVTRNSLRSFLYPLDGEGDKVAQPPDQILDEKAISHSPAETSSAAEGVEEDVEASSSVLYNSKVESGSITFNFNSTVDENVKQQSVDSNIDCVSSKDREGENDHTEQNDGNSDDLSKEPSESKNDRTNSGDNVSRQTKYDEGETSFSAASLVTYSGPIAFSGSLSLRSDGSAASGRSFAFPILQSEWNSSPVRMAKADRRHFRKHKGWRSGLLCCRF